MMFYLLGADNGLTNLGKSRQIGLFIFLVAFFWNSTQEILEVGAWSLKVNQKNCFQLLGYCYHDDTIIDNSDKLRQYIVLYIHNILKVYDCEEDRKYSQLQYGDMSETETVGEKVLSGL